MMQGGMVPGMMQGGMGSGMMQGGMGAMFGSRVTPMMNLSVMTCAAISLCSSIVSTTSG